VDEQVPRSKVSELPREVDGEARRRQPRMRVLPRALEAGTAPANSRPSGVGQRLRVHDHGERPGKGPEKGTGGKRMQRIERDPDFGQQLKRVLRRLAFETTRAADRAKEAPLHMDEFVIEAEFALRRVGLAIEVMAAGESAIAVAMLLTLEIPAGSPQP